MSPSIEVDALNIRPAPHSPIATDAVESEIARWQAKARRLIESNRSGQPWWLSWD
jgi:hypothetical protein